MSYQVKLQILKLNGWTDEQISTNLGVTMQSSGPTSMTIYRWRTGRTTPSRVFRKALDTLFDFETEKGEDHEQNH